MQKKNQKKDKVSKAQIPKGKGSFIFKLIEILKLYPEVIHWTEDGKRIKVSNVQKMQKQIIPSYYRHSNINSFVRQLNMYYFSKLETQSKNQMLFQNKNFTSDNFHLIQRRNKGRDQLLDKIHDKFSPVLERIKNNKNLSEEAKEMLTASIQYQQITIKNLEKIRNNIGTLSNQMKNSRGKQVRQILNKLKTTYTEKITEIMETGKKIDQTIKESLCKDEQEVVYKATGSQIIPEFRSYPFNEFIIPYNMSRGSCSIIKSFNEIEGDDEQSSQSISFGKHFNEEGQAKDDQDFQNLQYPDE